MAMSLSTSVLLGERFTPAKMRGNLGEKSLRDFLGLHI
jgi:hypothetical protein